MEILLNVIIDEKEDVTDRLIIDFYVINYWEFKNPVPKSNKLKLNPLA